MERIVVGYSGGLGCSIVIPWLKNTCAGEIIAVTVDVGQGDEIEAVRDRALAAGASRAHVLDRREEFARDFILPALKAGAMGDDGSPMAAALSRSLIAQTLVDVAGIEGASAVAHGAPRRGAHQAPLECACRQLNPQLDVMALPFDWTARGEAIEHARRFGVPVTAALEHSCAVDTNLWGRSIECGAGGEPFEEPSDEVYVLTRAVESCPQEPAYVELAFDRGAPLAINGVEMPLVDLLASLSAIAGGHGVGRIMRRSRPVGSKSRTVYEAPAAVVLHQAHRELQKLVMAKDLERFSRTVARQYASLVRDGSWFAPMRNSLDAFVASAQEQVTGAVRLKLFKGDVHVAGRHSPHAAFDPTLTAEETRRALGGSVVVGFPGTRPAPLSAAKARA